MTPMTENTDRTDVIDLGTFNVAGRRVRATMRAGGGEVWLTLDESDLAVGVVAALDLVEPAVRIFEPHTWADAPEWRWHVRRQVADLYRRTLRTCEG
ncbi:MAG: hypothetical protein ACRDXX_18955 [Stackebrandtia sp.]